MMNGRSRRSALLLLGGPALAGCDGLGVAGVGVTSGAAAPASAHVDSPEVFRVAEPGLWDGRPSLGGICVAHLDVIDPERVRIVNATNGQGVIGALFRRERDLPAPALQVSSNAAEALGMLAGAPAALDVKALRRQDAPAAPAEEPAPAAEEAPAAEASESEAEAEASLEIVAAEPMPAAPAPADSIATTTLDNDPAAPATSALERPFVRIGTFEAEANARAAATQIAGQGLPVTGVEGQGFWRLLLGPATTEAQQDALLEGAVAARFADAYLVAS